MKKDDLYIAILKHGHDIIRKSVARKSVKEHLENLGHIFDTSDMKRLYIRLFILPQGRGGVGGMTEDTTCYMEMDAYFNCLEYIELKEARRASKIAIYFAVAAIGISIIAMVVSTCFSYKQLKSSTKIETSQFEKIEEWINKK